MKRLLALALLIAFACRNTPYDSEITKWQQDRRTRLMAEDGWLTLVNLQWLHEGENAIEKPAGAGKVILQKGVVTLQGTKGLTIEGKPVDKPVRLVDDTDPKGPTVVRLGSVRFNAIKRADRYGIRVKDPDSAARKHFRGLEYFPVAPKWRVAARFEPFKPARHVAITNVLGMTTDEVAPGLLVFKVGGKEYKVEPILEQGETDYFLIFKDATSGKETYGAARYVYAPPPDARGMTVIDFNKAYNPPCAFTAFATCPLPPSQNRLPFRIEAGEKKYAGGH